MSQDNRNHIYVNLIRFFFDSGEESLIQNFYPPSEENTGYQFNNKIWYYFPFEVQGFNSSLEFNSISSSIKMPNIEDVNKIWETKLNRSNFANYLEGADLDIIFLFLDPNSWDGENQTYSPYVPLVQYVFSFSVNSLSFSPGVIILNLRNPINSIDLEIPNQYFSGKYYSELPIDNTPRFTSGTSYD